MRSQARFFIEIHHYHYCPKVAEHTRSAIHNNSLVELPGKTGVSNLICHRPHEGAFSYARPNPYSVYSDDPRNPVVYMKVPRQRGILPSGNESSGFRQFEAMEKIVEPLGSELFRV